MKYLFLFIGALLFTFAAPADALTFGIQTPQETVQTRIDGFSTARKAYAQLKAQGADEPTLVIQGRVVLTAMLDVFDVALNDHEDQFDALKSSGATDEAVYASHKTRIEEARKWIDEQRELVSGAETRSDLQDRSRAFRDEWRMFRRDAMVARSDVLIARAEMYLGKAENVLTRIGDIQKRLTGEDLSTAEIDESAGVMNEKVAGARTSLAQAQTDFDALRTLDAADESSMSPLSLYQKVMTSLVAFRSRLVETRTELGVFRELVRALGQTQ